MGRENERVFEQFLQRERVEVLMPTMETTRSYAQLFRQLREAGTPIPTNDIWIAAITIQHNLYLSMPFRRFPGCSEIAYFTHVLSGSNYPDGMDDTGDISQNG